jgi:hypothetical protein
MTVFRAGAIHILPGQNGTVTDNPTSTGRTKVLWFECKVSLTGSCAETCVPTDGTIWGGGTNFRRWGLAGGSESLGCALLRYTLSLVPSCHFLFFLSTMLLPP